jgi:triphosphoribosyl-dephospho-CoA synthase
MKKSQISFFLKKQIKLCCYKEMDSIKPGNVHKYSEGHNMTTKDFYKSADIISKCLTKNNSHFCKKIFESVVEIKKKIKQNTNLGIILLLAPITSIILENGILSKKKLHQRLIFLIKKQNIKNSMLFYKAIKIAKPGGLGQSNNYDVNNIPNVGLYNAMKYAEKKDLIAKQYVTGFKDIFKIGLPTYKKFKTKFKNDKWALTGVYLNFLNKLTDSHIKRKKGKKDAKKVRKDAKNYFKLLKYKENDISMSILTKKLLLFDKKLKSKGINPGTSADLTVTTFFIEKVTKK